MRIIRRASFYAFVGVMAFLVTFPVVNAMILYGEPRITRIAVQSVPAAGQTAEPSITIAGKVTPVP